LRFFYFKLFNHQMFLLKVQTSGNKYFNTCQTLQIVWENVWIQTGKERSFK